MYAHAHGVGAGFQQGDDASLPGVGPQSIQGSGDGGGVVGEVVIDGDAIDAGAHLHTPFHVAKPAQRLGRLPGRDARVARRGDGRQGVVRVVFPHQLPNHFALQGGVTADFESGAISAPVGDAPVCFLLCGKGLAGGPASLRQYLLHDFVGRGYQQQTVAGHRPHQVVKLLLDRRQVGKDVRVIEFDIVDDECPWAVVDEFGALVEEGGVVLVRLDDEERGVTQSCTDAEILRDASDQESRSETGLLQYPGQHARGGGLAVGSGDRQHPPSLQHLFGQPLRPGGIGNPPLQDRFHQRISS